MGKTPAAPDTEPRLSAGAQILLILGCFPSPPVRDVGTSSPAPLFSPLSSDVSVTWQMDGRSQSLPMPMPQELLRSDRLMAAPLLSKGEKPRADLSLRMEQGELQRERAGVLPSPAFSTGPRGADPLVRKSEEPMRAHVIGCLDTYRALEQHILEGKAVACELMHLTRPALGLPNCLLPGKEVKCGQDSAGSGWGPDTLKPMCKVAPEPNISPEACRAGKQLVASSLGAAAGTALQWWAGQGEPLGAVGCKCPGSACPCTPFLQALQWTGTGHLWGSASTLHGILEQCVSLLTAFWSTVLPISPAQHQGKVSTGEGLVGRWSWMLAAHRARVVLGAGATG